MKSQVCKECGDEYPPDEVHECESEEIESIGGTRLRIRRANDLNWVIERWRPAGKVERGPHKGKMRVEGWDTLKPLGYFPSLKHAAVRLLDYELANSLERGEWSGADLTAAINAAVERVEAAVTAAIESSDSPSSIEGSQAPQWEMSTEDAQSVLDAASPSKRWLEIVKGRRFKRTSDETRRGLKPDEAARERATALINS